MNKPAKDNGLGGIRRFFTAMGYSFAGIRHAILHEAAIRDELIALALLVPVSAMLPISAMEHLALVASMMLVVLVELLNSAIEAAVDLISPERHPLAKAAKDLGSAAVLVAILISGLCWVVIAGPVVVRWFQ